MVRAVDGMMIESRNVLISFLLIIYSFAISTIAYYWFIMNDLSAIVCSIIVGIGMIIWFVYAVRIMLRFRWDEMATDWAQGEDEYLQEVRVEVLFSLFLYYFSN